MTTPRDDMNQLLNHAVQTAGQLIATQGGFYAFGAALTSEGQLDPLSVEPEIDGALPSEPDPIAVRDTLHEALRNDAESGNYRAVCAVTDGLAATEDGSQVDAVIIRMEHEAHEPVLLALPYYQQEGGQWTFGELARAPYDELQFFKKPA